jgi:hypothetical protein
MTTRPQWQEVHTLPRVWHRQYFVWLWPVKECEIAAKMVVSRPGRVVTPSRGGLGHHDARPVNFDEAEFDTFGAGVS